MIGFIHITKTGGTNIKDKNQNKEIIYDLYHNHSALYFKEKNIISFAILRCPIDRYISAFNFHVNGSNTYDAFNFHKSNPIKYPKKDNYDDFNEFIDEHYNNYKNYINNYEDGVLFKKQIDWLINGNNDMIYVVKYDSINLIEYISQLFNSLNINFIYDINSENINVSNIKKKITITETSKNKIIEMYKEDYELYTNLLKTEKNFCKLSEIF